MFSFRKPGRRAAGALGLLTAFLFLLPRPASAAAADLESAQNLFLHGSYSNCIRQAKSAVGSSTWDENWPQLLARAQLAVGDYPGALKTVEDALDRYRSSLPLRLLASEVFTANGQGERAADLRDELNQLASSRMRYNRDAASLVALGRAALLLHAEPKLVLENFFDQAKRLDPNCRDAFLASGELALDKNDFALAAKIFNEALKKFPDDPEIKFGLARAYASSSPDQAADLLDGVLEFNTNHVPTLLLLADRLVDAEQYGEAGQMLDRAHGVNPWNPEAWAYRAVLAHLRNDTNAEIAARANGLKFWTNNPLVDHIIGRKLSQKYRFAEGSRYQEQALKFDPGYLPARMQLAEDLLRLGDEKQGWQFANDVHDQDAYDVTAYNLITLQDTLAKFQTLTNRDFIVRMTPSEAALYGDRVLELLQRARDRLSEKYGFTPDRPTVVEIFHEQKDFGVRTFGLPHNPGFLGVCFGNVITANSPAAQGGHPENWEAVLWHEFCHVITLGLTRNRMPRWLSEGISVYEERQANLTWGQAMNPRYREMILGKDFTPVGKLSAAFMNPQSSLHVQFAYYESYLVVDFLVQNFGLDALKQILADLGRGVEINDAIARHTAPMEKIEKDFAAFARARANNLAPALDWTKPREKDKEPSDAAFSILAANPNSTNYWILLQQARTALQAKKWADAKPPLQKLIELYPNQSGADNAYGLLARVQHALGETNEEHQTLVKLAARENDATDAFLRLMDLDAAAGDWASVATNAERFLAVNPLVPQPYRHLARASEELGHADAAIRSYHRLLLLDPPDPAEVHYRLARLLYKQGDLPAAKRHVLQALEEAPRYRDAQRLLLDLDRDVPPKTTSVGRRRREEALTSSDRRRRGNESLTGKDAGWENGGETFAAATLLSPVGNDARSPKLFPSPFLILNF